MQRVVGFESLGIRDVERVGGKNASLGEMISRLGGSGVQVPGGFATTAAAFREVLARDGLATRIEAALGALDVADVVALAACGAKVRGWVEQTPLGPELEAEIAAAYTELGPRVSRACRRISRA